MNTVKKLYSAFTLILIGVAINGCAGSSNPSLVPLPDQAVLLKDIQIYNNSGVSIKVSQGDPLPHSKNLSKIYILAENYSNSSKKLSLSNIKIENDSIKLLSDEQALGEINAWQEEEIERAKLRERRLAFGSYAQYEADYSPGLFDGDIEYAPQAQLDLEILQSQTRKRIEAVSKTTKEASLEINENYLNSFQLPPKSQAKKVVYLKYSPRENEKSDSKFSIQFSG